MIEEQLVFRGGGFTGKHNKTPFLTQNRPVHCVVHEMESTLTVSLISTAQNILFVR